MTVGDLREVVCDPEIPADLPVQVVTTDGRVWAAVLVGAHGALAGPDPHLVLELDPRP